MKVNLKEIIPLSLHSAIHICIFSVSLFVILFFVFFWFLQAFPA